MACWKAHALLRSHSRRVHLSAVRSTWRDSASSRFPGQTGQLTVDLHPSPPGNAATTTNQLAMTPAT
jgi:hypothetical protein